MTTPTYIPLATVTLGSSAATVTFSSIPATFRDLILTITGTASTSAGTRIYLNGDTTDANYSRTTMTGDGTSATASTSTDAVVGALDTTIGTNTIQIFDYSATDKHKTRLGRWSRPGTSVAAIASRWANTAAVTSVSISIASPNTISAGTTLSLYGIVA